MKAHRVNAGHAEIAELHRVFSLRPLRPARWMSCFFLWRFNRREMRAGIFWAPPSAPRENIGMFLGDLGDLGGGPWNWDARFGAWSARQSSDL